jgi:Ca2+-binding RTX toxin-like protein
LIAQQVSNLDGRVVGDAVDIGASEYKPKPASNPSNIIINEIDVDTPGTDNAEFIELYDGGTGNTSLDGYVVVLYNGNNDQSYAAYDLDGQSTNANGYFVIGSDSVPNVNLAAFTSNALQNGADAVALYQGDAADFSNGTPITTDKLIDAVVYDTSEPDDTGLLALLNSGQPQVNEDDSGDKDNQSLQRITNGSGGSRNTNTYQVAAPTPGAENILVTDTLPGGGDTLPGGGDTLPGGGDTLPGGGDTLPGGGDTLPGGGDTLPGGGDTLPGGATLTPLTDGKDRFRGTATNDQISSGTGNDFLKGGAGNDVFDAGADNDRVYGGIGEDTISGGTGKDYLNGGSGLDSLDGGEGRDKLYGGDGDDTLIGGVGNDFLKGENGNDSLDGGADRDRLYGNDGDDTLTGGSGNDKIYGGAGDDMITGVNADSFAVGEIDRLYGGADNDTFVLGNENGAFYADDDSTTKGKRDYAYILDFETGDTIELYGSADDYTLDVSRGSTSIYLNNDDENGVGDLIGKIKGVSFEDMNSGFSFAGGGNPDLT